MGRFMQCVSLTLAVDGMNSVEAFHCGLLASDVNVGGAFFGSNIGTVSTDIVRLTRRTRFLSRDTEKGA